MLHAATHRETGFSAQEAEQALHKTVFSFNVVDKPNNERALYGLRYADFVVPLVKAVQELQVIIDTQQKLIEQQEKRLNALEAKK